MRINQSEIIDDIDAHIRKFGGDYSEWCVGTARDSASFQQHQADPGEGLIYREAYTSYAADGVIERLVSGYGLRPDRAPARGNFVFVYRDVRTQPPKEAAVSAHA